VIATATPVHRGRRTQVWQTRLEDPGGKAGRGGNSDTDGAVGEANDARIAAYAASTVRTAFNIPVCGWQSAYSKNCSSAPGDSNLVIKSQLCGRSQCRQIFHGRHRKS